MTDQSRPGVRTSEFAILVALLAFAALAFAMERDEAAALALAAGLGSIGYSVSRGIVKKGGTP